MTTLNTFGSQASRDIANQNKKLRIEQGLSAFKNPIERAAEQPESLRRAITAKCYECVGMDGDKNYRESIRTCTSKKCPLFPVRPYQKKPVDGITESENN
jgi:hypothetical protein